jgi:hypothetical protein
MTTTRIKKIKINVEGKQIPPQDDTKCISNGYGGCK